MIRLSTRNVRNVCLQKSKRYLTDPEFAELMKQWDWEKNNELGLDPSKISIGTGLKAYWKCLICHEWEGNIRDRIRSKGSCPYCSNKKVLVGFNDLWTTHPHVASQLVNPQDGYEITIGSKRRVQWFCYLKHKWFSNPYEINRSKGKGCPYCSNQKILKGYNDLWSTDPELAIQLFDQTVGYKYSRGSHVKVWWKCDKDHLYLSMIKHRTIIGTQCPKCSNQVSLPERHLIELLEDQGLSVISQHKISGLAGKADLFLPKLDLIIEYDGSFFHTGRMFNDMFKTKLLLNKGFRVVRIREKSTEFLPILPCADENLLQVSVQYDRYMNHLDVDLVKIITEWVL